MRHVSRSSPPTGRPGVAAVEFAVIFPLLLLLLLGIWELGRMVQVAQILNNAAREGARQAAAGIRSREEIRDYIRGYLAAAGLNTAGMTDPVIENLDDSTRHEPPLGEQNQRYQVTVVIPTANFRWWSPQAMSAFTPQTYGRTTLQARATWMCLADKDVGSVSESIPN